MHPNQRLPPKGEAWRVFDNLTELVESGTGHLATGSRVCHYIERWSQSTILR
jgi:hypothetical protein